MPEIIPEKIPQKSRYNRFLLATIGSSKLYLIICREVVINLFSTFNHVANKTTKFRKLVIHKWS